MAENDGRERRNGEKHGEGTGGRSGMSAGLSVWALLARSSFCQVLAMVFLLAAAETALFCHTLQRGEVAALGMMIEESGARSVFLAAFGVVFVILIRTEGILDSAGRYTMMRLRIARERLFAVKTVYNVLCLLMLFMAQTGLIFWFAWLYGRMPEVQGVADGQRVFLAFYGSEFLHGVFPMAEAGKWVRNGLMLLAFGMEAGGGFGRRQQVTQAALFGLLLCLGGSIGTGWLEAFCDMAFLVVIGTDLRGAYDFRREAKLCGETGRSGRA